MTVSAMLVYPDFFKVGVAMTSPNDPSIYYNIWAERYFGVKKVKGEDGVERWDCRPDGNLELARYLEGKLLMIYGPRTRSASMPAPLAAMTAASGFKALGEETRLRIVQLTATQEMYAHEIGLEFDQLGQPAISRHLRHLAAEGFLNVREAQAKKFYSLNRDRVRGLLMQMETLLAASEPDPERKV